MPLKFVGIRRASETYLFFYIDDCAEDLLQVFARFAKDPDLSFTWSQASELGALVRQQSRSEAVTTR